MGLLLYLIIQLSRIKTKSSGRTSFNWGGCLKQSAYHFNHALGSMDGRGELGLGSQEPNLRNLGAARACCTNGKGYSARSASRRSSIGGVVALLRNSGAGQGSSGVLSRCTVPCVRQPKRNWSFIRAPFPHCWMQG